MEVDQNFIKLFHRHILHCKYGPILVIFSFLPFTSMLKCTRVCKEFKKAIELSIKRPFSVNELYLVNKISFFLQIKNTNIRKNLDFREFTETWNDSDLKRIRSLHKFIEVKILVQKKNNYRPYFDYNEVVVFEFTVLIEKNTPVNFIRFLSCSFDEKTCNDYCEKHRSCIVNKSNKPKVIFGDNEILSSLETKKFRCNIKVESRKVREILSEMKLEDNLTLKLGKQDLCLNLLKEGVFFNNVFFGELIRLKKNKKLKIILRKYKILQAFSLDVRKNLFFVALIYSNDEIIDFLVKNNVLVYTPSLVFDFLEHYSNFTNYKEKKYEKDEAVSSFFEKYENFINFNYKRNENTLLHLACKQILPKTVKFLVTKTDLKVNYVNNKNDTPLHLPFYRGALSSNQKRKEEFELKRLEIVKLLVENGASLKALDKNNRIPLFDAIRQNRFICSVYLIEKGSEFQSVIKQTNINDAIKSTGSLTFFKFLQKRKFSFNFPNEKTRSPIIYTLNYVKDPEKRLEYVKFFTDVKVDVNSVDKSSKGGLETGIMISCSLGSIELFDLLLSNGANVKLKDKIDQNCFHFLMFNDFNSPKFNLKAIKEMERKKLVIAEKLLLLGCDFSIKSKLNQYPLKIALHNKFFDLSYFLLKNNVDYSFVRDFRSIFNECCEFGGTNFLKWLFENVSEKEFLLEKEDMNSFLEKLFLVSINRNYPITEFLLWEKHLDLSVNYDLDDYLHVVCSRWKKDEVPNEPNENERIKIIKLLLENKFEPNRLDLEGRSPIEIAVENSLFKLVNFLLDKVIEVKDKEIWRKKFENIFICLCIKKETRIAKRMINLKLFDIENFKYHKTTPITSAARYDCYEIVKYLNEKGVNVNIRDRNLQTSLHVAKKRKNVKIMDYLLNNGKFKNEKFVKKTKADLKRLIKIKEEKKLKEKTKK